MATVPWLRRLVMRSNWDFSFLVKKWIQEDVSMRMSVTGPLPLEFFMGEIEVDFVGKGDEIFDMLSP